MSIYSIPGKAFTESKTSEGPSPCATGGCAMGQSCEAAQAGECGGGMCGL